MSRPGNIRTVFKSKYANKGHAKGVKRMSENAAKLLSAASQEFAKQLANSDAFRANHTTSEEDFLYALKDSSYLAGVYAGLTPLAPIKQQQLKVNELRKQDKEKRGIKPKKKKKKAEENGADMSESSGGEEE